MTQVNGYYNFSRVRVTEEACDVRIRIENPRALEESRRHWLRGNEIPRFAWRKRLRSG
jgi:hypothetical protein